MTVREFQKQIDDKHDACRVDQRVRISAEVGGLMAQQYCPAGVVVPQRVRQIERAGGYCEDKAEAKYQCGHARSFPGIPEIRRRDLPKTEYLAGTGAVVASRTAFRRSVTLLPIFPVWYAAI